MIPRTREDALAALAIMGEQPDDRFDLTAAALCCAVHETPDADISEALAVLDSLSQQAIADQPRTAAALAMLCFGAFGFIGARDDFDDPGNANLTEILVRRRGLPVGLGIVWRHVAKLSGARLSGTNTPARFLMRLDHDSGGGSFELIDVFEGGAIVPHEDLFLKARRPGQPAFSMKSLAPVPDRVIAVRLQTNLATRAREDGRLEDWERAAHRRALLCPWDGRLHLDHAEAALALGQIHAARHAATRASLDHNGHTAQAAAELLTRLTRRLN
jgi:regulator of sirC expression with transglutaminase-like and TPR domain